MPPNRRVRASRPDAVAIDPTRLLIVVVMAVGTLVVVAALLPGSRDAVDRVLGRPVDMGAMLLLTGSVLFLDRRARGRRGAMAAATVMALAVLGLGALALTGPVIGDDISIGRYLIDLDGGRAFRGVPRSFAGGVSLLAVAAALLALIAERVRAAQMLALLVLVIAMVGLLHNAYYEENQGIGITPYVNMRSTSAAVFAIAALGILAARQRQAIVGILFGENAGTEVARRLVPIVIVVPLALGWLRYIGQSFGLFDVAFAAALFPVANMTVMLAVIWRVSAILNRVGQERRQARLALESGNAELARSAEELRLANAELEAFAYTVAHDLRAPLRAIDGFSRVLMEDHAGTLEAEAARLLGVVRRNTVRMGNLMDDLLAFSRLSRRPINKRAVAPAAIVTRVLDDGAREREGRDLEIAIGDLPECQADFALLTQVYANLIGNAVKYSSKKAAARIDIGSRQEAGKTVYFVADNGAGFDMAHAAKLFGVFQRLHRADEYDGTGVGLAIVQRILHRHGGAIWAEARVGEGATFFFTLG